jgi:hypothetical protein
MLLGTKSAAPIAVAAALCVGIAARAHDMSKYPDWTGRWLRATSASFDPDRPGGRAQSPPLKPEYQRIFEASLAAQSAGGQGLDPMAHCIPPGMPRMMIGYGLGMQILITSETTYMVLGDPMYQFRHIYTDGRSWPDKITPTFSGYSIGQWQDTDGDGRYDMLAVETRAIKGPRSYDSSGIPFHEDGRTTVKERIYLDNNSPTTLHDDITVMDDALTRPWSVKRTYSRKDPGWLEAICGEDQHQARIGKEDYYVSGDGYLMPTRKDQPSPDLKYFEQQK